MIKDYEDEDREALIIGYESGLGVRINPNSKCYNALLKLFESIQEIVRSMKDE